MVWTIVFQTCNEAIHVIEACRRVLHVLQLCLRTSSRFRACGRVWKMGVARWSVLFRTTSEVVQQSHMNVCPKTRRASFPEKQALQPRQTDRPPQQKLRLINQRKIRVPSSPFRDVILQQAFKFAIPSSSWPTLNVEDLKVTELDASSTAALLARRPSDVSRRARFGLWLHCDIYILSSL